MINDSPKNYSTRMVFRIGWRHFENVNLCNSSLIKVILDAFPHVVIEKYKHLCFWHISNEILFHPYFKLQFFGQRLARRSRPIKGFNISNCEMWTRNFLGCMMVCSLCNFNGMDDTICGGHQAERSGYLSWSCLSSIWVYDVRVWMDYQNLIFLVMGLN